jgi:hypothetical protein
MASDRAATRRAAAGLDAGGPPDDRGGRTVWVRQLLGRPVVGPEAQHLGHVHDVAVRQTAHPREAAFAGLITDTGGVRMFVPAAAVRRWPDPQVLVDAVRLRTLRDQDLADGVLLGSIIGQLVMTGEGDIARIGDVGIRRMPGGWFIGPADMRGLVERFLGLPRRPVEWEDLVRRRPASPRR